MRGQTVVVDYTVQEKKNSAEKMSENRLESRLKWSESIHPYPSKQKQKPLSVEASKQAHVIVHWHVLNSWECNFQCICIASLLSTFTTTGRCFVCRLLCYNSVYVFV